MMMFNRFRSPICIWDYGQRSAAASICLGLHDNKNNPMEHMKLAIRRKRKEKEKKCLQFNQSINNTPIWRTVFPRWAWKRDKTEYRVKKHGPAGHQKSCITNRKRQRRYFEYNIDGMKDIDETQSKKKHLYWQRRLIWKIVVKNNMTINTQLEWTCTKVDTVVIPTLQNSICNQIKWINVNVYMLKAPVCGL